MSLSNCDKCDKYLDTPCECGWEYRRLSKQRLVEMRDMLQQLIDGVHRYSVAPQDKGSAGQHSSTQQGMPEAQDTKD